jgi:L-lactate dehydrogenase complex protein LldG
MSAREEILARVRRALADVPADEPRDAPAVDRVAYLPIDGAVPDAVAHFAERAADYRAAIRYARPDTLAAAVAEVCAVHRARRIGVPTGLPGAWVPSTIEPIVDDGLGVRALDALDGVLTGCALAIAATGTVVLDGGARSGRRALTLVPDLHICVVEAWQIVAGLPAAIAALDPTHPTTFVSGPSATSDIELERVEGVHGPRRLALVIVTDETPPDESGPTTR